MKTNATPVARTVTAAVTTNTGTTSGTLIGTPFVAHAGRCTCSAQIWVRSKTDTQCRTCKKAAAEKVAAERARLTREAAAAENKAAFMAAVARGETFPPELVNVTTNGRQVVVRYPGGGFTAYLPKAS